MFGNGPNNDPFFGGMFDFNQDGKTDLGERTLGFLIMDQLSRDDEDDEDDD